ncbi:ATP-dependent DNA helicase RRM3-like [Pecten maximus]|uniref:ATP-dependent DNA helicase RRM3-like n=1 Tax=Pecten maximus TaxID=6579 RepID=UPI0014590387|nr:ATP-dependent DNA helicase RRM3-like [Pecten maximus]
MDEDQANAFELVKNGHNVIITGQAGSGKTYLVKWIVKYRRKCYKNVSIVCSTGIAATHYGDLGAQTLHKWSGIEDGRHLNEEIAHLVKTDERFMKAKQNIETVDVLIIDEVSMVSAKVLNQVQFLCKHVRNSKEVFGQIQVVLVGDFYQLPPVANQLHGDSGKPCFLLPWFDDFFPHKVVPHKVVLNEIHRQEDTTLIQCINELVIGHPSDDTVAFLKSLDRPLANEMDCIQLFARNLDVDLFNFEKLNQLDGELKRYKATDEGSEHYLGKFLAPRNLALKVGCPVMLVQNRSDELVNGLRGVVTKLLSDSVEVKFAMEKKTTTTNIERTTFTTFDPVKKLVVAKRAQLPLKLAYAMTVHKSQGMSLENVVVNCQKCFQAGQLGVAVGRAVSVDGLKVVNFKKSLCKQHPVHVKLFHQNISVGHVRADLTCKKQIQQDLPSEDKNDEPSDTNMHDSDFSDSEIKHLTFLDNFIETNILTAEESLYPSKVALDSVLKEFLDTPTEERMLSFKQKLLCDFQKYDD